MSIVMPVFNPSAEFLERAIQSVVRQSDSDWELCIADDGSTEKSTIELLEKWAGCDSRITVEFTGQNRGISAATNTAAEMATGEYLAFLDNDDELSPDAVSKCVRHLCERPEIDLLYSDEDQIDAEGCRRDLYLKPDWSPEMLLSYMYLGHLLVIRTNLFRRIGGLRSVFDGSQDHDLVLRASENATNISHIQEVLYHWRAIPTSTASSGHSKPASAAAGRAAVKDALTRRGIPATVYRPGWAVVNGSSFYCPRFPDHGPRVAVFIPTRDQVGDLRACVESLAKTTYSDFEIVLIDNGTSEPETLSYLAASPHRLLRVPSPEGKYGFAAVYNEAVRQVDSDYVLFLNNDTEVLTPDWLSEMAGYLGIPGIGAVGARLEFASGGVQNAGTVEAPPASVERPRYRLAPSKDSADRVQSMSVRNYVAVSAACMITARDLFLEMNGFRDGPSLSATADFDYCYRLGDAGYRVVYCPQAQLLHRGRFVRGFEEDRDERGAFWAVNSSFMYEFPHDPSTYPRRMGSHPQAVEGGLRCAGTLAAAESTVQLFWTVNGGLSEAKSIRIPFVPDGMMRELRFDIPRGAQGPLRLDPGSGFFYGEIESVAIIAIPADSNLGGPPAASPVCVARWSRSDGFGGFFAANDLMVIPSATTYKFLCLGQDPQLLLNVLLPEDQSHVLEITMALLADFQNPVLGDLASMTLRATEAEASLLQVQSEAESRVAGVESAMKETEARMLGLRDELRRVKSTSTWRVLSVFDRFRRRLGNQRET